MDGRGGSEWGWASLVLGAVFAVMAPVVVLLVYVIGADNFRATDVVPASIGGGICGSAAMALCGLGIVFGVRDVGESRRAGRPPALGLAGALLCGFDLLVWAGAAVGWVANIWNRLP